MNDWDFPKFNIPNGFLEELSATIKNFNATYFGAIQETLNSFRTTYFDAIQSTLNEITSRFGEVAKGLSEWSRPYRAIEKLGDNQYVYWDYLDDEMIDKLLQSTNVNKTMRELNARKNYADIKAIASKCSESPRMAPYQTILKQAMTSFKNGGNELALLGFLSIIDGLLSDVSNNITSTSIYGRANPILEKLENSEAVENNEYAELALLITFRDTMESLSAKSDFSKKEPKNLNRHWIMHGRSRRRKTRLDCVKMIRFIYGIILLDEFSRKEAELHNE